MVTTYAGSGTEGHADGVAAIAQFNSPTGVSIDDSGNIYVADALNNRVRLISQDGMVSTLAGNGMPGFEDGPAEDAMFESPSSVTVDIYGNAYIADAFNHRIRKIGNCAKAAIVPTLTEWSILILALSLLIIGVIALKQKRLLTAYDWTP